METLKAGLEEAEGRKTAQLGQKEIICSPLCLKP